MIILSLVTTIPSSRNFFYGPLAQILLDIFSRRAICVERLTLRASARAIRRTGVQIPYGPVGLVAQPGRASGFYWLALATRNQIVVSSNLAGPIAERHEVN